MSYIWDRTELTSQAKELNELRRLVEELQRKQKRPHAPFSKGPPKADPKRPGRKPGEAYGRKAYRPVPMEFDEVYEVPRPCLCPACQGEVEWVETAEQYQVEIPRRPIYRKFHVPIGRCTRCGRRVQGRHPLQTSDALGAAASQLGPDAQALAVQLNKETGLSHGKVVRLFQAAFGIVLSRGGSAQLMLRAAERSTPQYREIVLAVRYSAVVYPDETGWKVGGVLWWLWAFVCSAATLYLIRPSRGSEVAEAVLGAQYAGCLGHDGWPVYNRFKAATHQQCLAHLLRRCHHLLQSARRRATCFPLTVKRLLQDSLSLRARREAGTLSGHGLAIAYGKLQARLNRLLAGRYTYQPNARFARHLTRHRDALFTYLKHPEIEATNWPAEQALRPAVVNRKVWGGSRTPRGAEAQSILMSVLRTSHQHDCNSLETLSQILRAPPGRAPSLLPQLA
jgi:transposase